MPSGLVLTAPEDLPELTEFLLGVFHTSCDAPFVRPEMMRWKYFMPRPDWNGPRSYLMRSEGRICAHGCVSPVTFGRPAGSTGSGTELVTGMRVIDWAGGRRAPAAGVTIMRQLAALADTVLAIGGSPEAMRVFPKIGFRHRGNVEVFARVVRPWRQFRADPYPRGWKAPLRLARSTLSSLPRLPGAPAGWSSRAVQRFDSSLCPVLEFDGAGFTTTRRTPALLNYMLDCPGAAFSGFLVRQGERIRGYFLLSHVAGQTRIADVRVDSGSAEDWLSAFTLATRQAAANPATCEILAVASTGQGIEALRRIGYRFCRHDPIFLMDPRGRLADAPELNLDLLVGDEAYLHVPGYPFET
jgi:hypothetical protein